MDLFHCGSQWGYTPMGRVARIPGGYCNQPTGLTAAPDHQYVTLSWTAPHDFLFFEVNYRAVGALSWNIVNAFGTSILLTLSPSTEYEWQVRTCCDASGPGRYSTFASGPNFFTGAYIAGCSAVSAVNIQLQFDEFGNPYYEASWTGTGAQYYIINIYQQNTDVIVFTARVSATTYRIPDLSAVGLITCYEATATAVCQDLSLASESPRSLPFCPGGSCPKCRNLTYTVGQTTLAIGWFPPAEMFSQNYTYNIYLDGLLVASGFPDTMFTFTGLNPDTEYLVEVRANCPSSFSDVTALTVKTKPTACNEPTGLSSTGITATGATLNWTPGAGITSQELIINNGDPIALSDVANTYALTGLPSGSVLSARVRSVCGGLKTTGIETIVNLLGCATVTGLTLTVDSLGLHIKWNPVANRDHYIVDVSLNGGGWTDTEHITLLNEYLFPDIVKGGTYDVSVKAVCLVSGTLVEGTADTDSVTVATDPYGNCSRYAISDIIRVDNTTVGFTIGEVVNRPYGNPIRLVIYADGSTVTPVDTKVVFSPGYYELTNLVAGTAYDIYAYQIVSPDYVEANPLLDGCTLNNPTDYTHANCWIPTIANFNCSWSNPTTLVFALSGTSFTGNQTSLDLYYATEGDDWVFEANLAIPGGLPHNIAGLLRTRYRVKIVVYCSGKPMEPVISDWICPPTPTLTWTVSGTSLALSEGTDPTNYLGDNTLKYKLVLSSLLSSDTTYELSRDNLAVSGLLPNTIYTADIRLICPTDPVTYGSPQTFTFITGSEAQGICEPASFSAFIQDCALKDPINLPPNVDPGGSNDCGFDPMSWDVISYVFVKDPENNLSSKYYFEAIIALNNSEPSGDVLMPGGTAAAIRNTACYPNISSTLDVAIISGATALIAASATLGNDGNLIVSGTYTTNGASRLLLKVSGTYTFA